MAGFSPTRSIFGLLPLLNAPNKQTAERALEFVRVASSAIDEAERAAAYEQLSDGARRKLEARESSPTAQVAAQVPQGLLEAFEFAQKQKMKAPTWLTPANVPAVTIEGGRLPEDYLTVLLAALKDGDPRVPHPFVLAMRCYATPDSLDAFAVAVFEQWRTLGMESREKWVLFAPFQSAFDSGSSGASARPLCAQLAGRKPEPGGHARSGCVAQYRNRHGNSSNPRHRAENQIRGAKEARAGVHGRHRAGSGIEPR